MQGKDLDLSIVISPKAIYELIRRDLHFLSVAKLLRLSIYQLYLMTMCIPGSTLVMNGGAKTSDHFSN